MLANSKKMGIYLIDEEGNEHFYSLDDFFAYGANDFADWAEDFRPLDIYDTVRICDVGQSYSTYYSWFASNNIAVDIAARYAFNFTIIPEHFEGEDFVVVATGYHENGEKLYAISSVRNNLNGPVYLFNKKGIRKI